MLAFLGFFYGVENIHEIAPAWDIALPTVAGVWLLCLGILSVRPEEGLVAMFVGRRPSAVLNRWLLPAVILLPLLIGWFGVRAERAGLFGLGFGSALLATTLMAIFAALVWWTARELNRLEAERQQGAEALRRSNAVFDGILSSAIDAVISIDSQERVVLFNAAAEKMFGVSAHEAFGQSMDRFIPARFRAAHHGHFTIRANRNYDRKTGRLGAVNGLRADGTEFLLSLHFSG